MARLATQIAIAPDADACLRLISEVAAQEAVPPVPLRLAGLLHLPRIADRHGLVEERRAYDELRAHAANLRQRTSSHAGLDAPPRVVPASPTGLRLLTDESIAQVVLTEYHYLHSFRAHSDHVICATPEGRPAALATVSSLDLPTIQGRLPPSLPPSRVRVLSRVFAFEWAPPNTLTWLFGQLARRLRGEADLLLTYVNPNVGFTGASYRAGNWSAFGYETGTRYAYEDRRYVTDRYLIQAHGTSDPSVLGPALGSRISYSAMSLRPLMIYALPLTPAARAVLPASPWVLPRPTP